MLRTTRLNASLAHPLRFLVPQGGESALKRKPTIASTELIAKLQGGYYVATGIWPLLSMRTFEAITGPKVDKWLVKTVGTLVSVIGATLWVGGTRRQVAPELKLLAMGSAAGLTAIEIV
jgi:hypothetical protein